eukprot:Nitzschia sp. Nitz4//scaffold38_size140716//100264//101959//NITZ4_003156-RA/size140716-snap-gene-0.148-mRNA-1//1//CDS//3329550105//5963//frame0
MSTPSENDPYLMDFGTSVSVNEDLHRVIRGEIQDLDDSIGAVGIEVKREETVGRQLRQDLSHSLVEIQNLRRGANDQKDHVQAHTTFLDGLRNTLQATMIGPSGRTIRGSLVFEQREHNGSSSNQPVGKADQTSYSKHDSTKAVIKSCENKFQSLSGNVKQVSNDMKTLVQEQRNVSMQIRTIQERIETENLQSLLVSNRKEAEDEHRELNTMRQAIATIQADLIQMRTQGGANAQRLADLTKQIDSNREIHNAEANRLQQQLLQIKEQEDSQRRELERLQELLHSTKTKHEQLNRMTTMVRNIQDCKQSVQQKTEENESLLRLKTELELQLKESEEKLAESKQELASAQESEARSLQLQKENEEKHNAIVVPGRVELSEIAEQKELFAKEIEQIQRINADKQVQQTEELSSKMATKRMILDECDSLEATLHEAENELKSVNLELAKSSETWEKSIAEQKEHLSQLEASIKAEDELRKEKQEELEHKKEEMIAHAKHEADSEIQAKKRLLKILATANQDLDKVVRKAREVDFPLDQSLFHRT